MGAPRSGPTSFKPGQSGNPGGRPKIAEEVKELARTYTMEAITRLAEWMRSDNPKASVSACNALLDRGFGKPAQAIEHSGQIGFFDMLATALIAKQATDGSGIEAGAPEGSSGSIQ